jgi:hypothetical protein
MGRMRWLPGLLFVAGCAAPSHPRNAPPLSISWEKNILSVTGKFPGGRIDTLYLEAFCRSGARDREWKQTVIPHTTRKISQDDQTIVLESAVEGGVHVTHRITAGAGEVDFQLEAVNRGSERTDVDWAQPCVRVGAFTGCDQTTYVPRSFIFVHGKKAFLDTLGRSEEAIYKGGQVYLPPGVRAGDCNPRPHSPDVPSTSLIGCVSADNRWLFATAWEPTQELFQGVIVCLHSDFRVGGLDPGETRRIHGKMYVMENDSDLLLARYRADFGR